MNSLDQQRKQVEVEIQLLNRQVAEMDGKIRAYLADRQNKPQELAKHGDWQTTSQALRIDVQPQFGTESDPLNRFEPRLDIHHSRIHHFATIELPLNWPAAFPANE